ncbi:MAG: hypothetical protein HZB30_07375 [Nitrospirae bacterium]|nr:hypothetical protein [Nitrospirota bacterium]
MDIDIMIGDKSLTISLENAHRFDLAKLMENVINFGTNAGADITGLRIEKLIPRMIKGVAGCEGGCPSDAKGFAREGFGNFNLSYVEGGILKAEQLLDNGEQLQIKVFPEFD